MFNLLWNIDNFVVVYGVVVLDISLWQHRDHMIVQ